MKVPSYSGKPFSMRDTNWSGFTESISNSIFPLSFNVAVEYESYGKPSGIAVTEADYWFHNLCIGDETFATLVFDVPSLKRIIDNLDYKKTVSGGDHNASRMYLLNIQKLFSSDVIKAYKNEQQAS